MCEKVKVEFDAPVNKFFELELAHIPRIGEDVVYDYTRYTVRYVALVADKDKMTIHYRVTLAYPQ